VRDADSEKKRCPCYQVIIDSDLQCLQFLYANADRFTRSDLLKEYDFFYIGEGKRSPLGVSVVQKVSQNK
jgi:hypothetical protein